MEQRQRRILEIGVAAVFVAFLVVLSLIVINADSDSKTETTITNSFNTYNYHLYRNTGEHVLTTRTRGYDYGYGDSYYINDDLQQEERYLSYDSDARLVVAEGIFGNKINRYEVYVRNNDYLGGNFKVIFFFEDYYGDIDSQSMIYYVPARTEKLFLFKDISPSRYGYRNWWYRVTPLTRTNSFYD